MIRFLRTLLLVIGLAAGTAAGLLLAFSSDPRYCVQEWLAGGRHHAYDGLIYELAGRESMDPALIKAIVWRESAFHPDKIGSSGERGLMQVGEAAAQDWAKANKIETFLPTDLFDPRTNLEVGIWYFKRALNRWQRRDNALPFALCEYNAGRTRVDSWIAATNLGEAATAEDLMGTINILSTRRYVQEIVRRYQFYQERGRL